VDARIAQGMEKSGDSKEALKGTKNVGDDRSWFRGTPYYWAEASLPFAYALACVEVVSENSEEAEIVQNKPKVLQVGLYLLNTGQRSG
jgi:hypothetical protein